MFIQVLLPLDNPSGNITGTVRRKQRARLWTHHHNLKVLMLSDIYKNYLIKKIIWSKVEYYILKTTMTLKHDWSCQAYADRQVPPPPSHTNILLYYLYFNNGTMCTKILMHLFLSRIAMILCKMLCKWGCCGLLHQKLRTGTFLKMSKKFHWVSQRR